MEYQDFLRGKKLDVEPSGFDVPLSDLNPMLFDWQKEITRWLLKAGKAAAFEDCGLGKSPQQLEWAKHVCWYTGKPVLIIAPLAVSVQTVREGVKFSIGVSRVQKQDEITPGINITNYDRLCYKDGTYRFDPDAFGGIVLDESSILKAFTGIRRKQITEFAKAISYRLCATATPAPNDLIEILNHAEFLDVMSGKEMIALFFTQDGNTTHKWRLMNHACNDFWKWMATWSIALRRPSDLGYDDDGFILPDLHIHEILTSGVTPEGFLFPVKPNGLAEEQAIRRASLDDRVKTVAELVNQSNETWIIWCGLNDESTALIKAIPDAVEIRGSHSSEYKEQAMINFSDGKTRVLVTKAKIAGFGMNWQHCANQAFCGFSHSFEQFYQTVRRSYRFGQLRDVNVYICVSENSQHIIDNVRAKEIQSARMFESIVSNMAIRSSVSKRTRRQEMIYQTENREGQNWTMHLGDSVETINHIETGSVGLTITSPPFPGMYVYTNSRRDVGNVRDMQEMIEHFRYLVSKDKLWRVTMPGRVCAIHLTQLTKMKSREGHMGLRNYRGAVIQLMEDENWHWVGEACISKNPQLQATRNKEHQLLFRSLANDSSIMRMALPDWLLIFRKPGKNPKPIRAGISRRYDNPNGWVTEDEWVRWADGIWWGSDILAEQNIDPEGLDAIELINYLTWPYYSKTSKYADVENGIRVTDVLNVRQARDADDERHLCPLQLGVIERCLKLWSSPDDLVYDPFAGVGSVGHKLLELNGVLRHKRSFVGGELKESYFRSAVKTLQRSESTAQYDLFSMAGIEI